MKAIVHLLAAMLFSAIIAHAEPQAPQEMYRKMTAFNVAKTVAVRNFSLTRSGATLDFESGEITIVEALNGRYHTALFTGRGVFRFRPPDGIERDQLHKFTGTRVLEEPFHSVLLRFSDPTADEILSKGNESAKKNGTCNKCKEISNLILKRYLRNTNSRILRDFYADRSGYFAAYFFSKSKGEFLLEIDPEQEEEISVTQHSTMDFIDVWSSFSLRDRKAEAELSIPYFEVAIDIEKNGEVKATATLDILPLASDLNSIHLNFSPLTELKEITDDRGNPCFFIYETAEDRIGEPPRKQNQLDVFLPSTFSKDEKRKLKFVYSSEHLIKRQGSRNEYLIHDTTGWYPTYGYLTRSASKVTYCYPDHLELFAAGKKLEERADEKRKCSTWEQKTPVVFVSFSMGEYKHKRLAVDGLPPADILSGKHHSGIRIGGSGLDNVAADVVNSVNFFQSLYGTYPFESIMATEIPASHGQGFPGFLHLSGQTFEDVSLAGIDEAFRAHEVSHQWWGHLVGWESYRDQWISEGFAQFSGALYADAIHENEGLLMKIVESWKNDILNRGSVRTQRYGAGKLPGRLTMGTDSGPIWLGIRLSSSKSPADYRLLVYNKGAYVVHMLRMMMKDFQTNSDERFFTMMKDFVKTYTWKNATTEGFQEIAEKHFGSDLQWFFDQWVYGTYVPKYEFKWNIEPSSDGKHILVGEIRQRNVPDGFRMPVPIYLDFGKDRFAVQQVLVDQPVKTIRLPLPEKPRNVQFNYQRAVLSYD